jgi:calpain-15
VWKRVGEVIKNPVFIGEQIDPGDILQGRIGDCYFLSAIAGLAEYDHRIKAIFPNLDINKNGIYMARVLHRGVLMEVIVDDYFPVSKKDGHLMGANPSGGNEIWVMILEKCWAKLYGSYEAIDGKEAAMQEDCPTRCFTLSRVRPSSSTSPAPPPRRNWRRSSRRWWRQTDSTT